MQNYQRILLTCVVILLWILIYFALYCVEWYSLYDANNILYNWELFASWNKRKLYLFLFYLLSFASLWLFTSFIKRQKYLLIFFWLFILLFWWKLLTSWLTACVRWYCSFYWYVDLLIYLFISLALAFVVSLLCLLAYYFYKFLKKKK